MPDIKLPKTGIFVPSGDPNAIGADPDAVLNYLPEAFANVLRSWRESLEARFGEMVATIITGTAGALFDIMVKTPEILGELTGRIAAHAEIGRVAGYAKVKPGVLDPRELAHLVFRQWISPGEYLNESARNGLDNRRANAILAAATPQITVSEATALHSHRIFSDNTGVAQIKLWGYGEQDAAHLLKLGRVYLNAQDITTAWLREDITESAATEKLRELGLDSADTTELKKLAFYIPQIPDLVRMAVREVFNPTLREKLDLDAEFPPDFAKWGRKQGVSEEWAKNYWAAHWELPSATQGFEMYHRTTFIKLDDTSPQLGVADGKPYYRVVSLDTLKNLLKAQDYAPTWRDKLEAISYNPLTRVDVRRMRELGLLDKGSVKKAYFDDGYSEENASRLAEFVERDVLDNYTGKTKSQMLTLFRHGVVTESELRTYLIHAQVPQEFIDVLIKVEQDLAKAERRDRRFRAIEQQYKRGIIVEAVAMTRLLLAGFTASDAADILLVWLEDKIAHQQRITIRDLKAAFNQGIIHEDKFRSELVERNFQADDIEILIQLAGPIDSTDLGATVPQV